MNDRERAKLLVSKMTFAEKMAQMRYDALPIERPHITGGMSACMVWQDQEEQPCFRRQLAWHPALIRS